MLEHISVAKQTMELHNRSSNETVTVDHNRAFLVFCGSDALSVWLSKAVQVRLTMTVGDSYENNRFSKQLSAGTVLTFTHSDVAKCWEWHCLRLLFTLPGIWNPALNILKMAFSAKRVHVFRDVLIFDPYLILPYLTSCGPICLIDRLKVLYVKCDESRTWNISTYVYQSSFGYLFIVQS